jgi:hypothetical protein
MPIYHGVMSWAVDEQVVVWVASPADRHNGPHYPALRSDRRCLGSSDPPKCNRTINSIPSHRRYVPSTET